MKLGKKITTFVKPSHPKGISIFGNYVRLEPLNSDKHCTQLFHANEVRGKNKNWDYLPYGPFDTEQSYQKWLQSIQSRNDPTFFTMIRWF